MTEKYLITHMFKNMANMYKVASPKGVRCACKDVWLNVCK